MSRGSGYGLSAACIAVDEDMNKASHLKADVTVAESLYRKALVTAAEPSLQRSSG